jgi:hypothetical protein
LSVVAISFSGIVLFDLVSLIEQAILVLLMLAYLPAAFGLAVAKKSSRFDQAGMEVAYLVLQQAGWLGMLVPIPRSFLRLLLFSSLDINEHR